MLGGPSDEPPDRHRPAWPGCSCCTASGTLRRAPRSPPSTECVVPADEGADADHLHGRRPDDARLPAGLRPGDGITAIDGTPVSTSADVGALIRSRGRAARRRSRRRATAREQRRPLTPVENTVTQVGRDGKRRQRRRRAADDAEGRLPRHLLDGHVAHPAAAGQPWCPARSGPTVTRPPGSSCTSRRRWSASRRRRSAAGTRDPNGPISVVGVGRIAGEIASANASRTAPRQDRPACISHARPRSTWRSSSSTSSRCCRSTAATSRARSGRGSSGGVAHGCSAAPTPVTSTSPRRCRIAYAVAIVLVGMSALLIYADMVNPIKLLEVAPRWRAGLLKLTNWWRSAARVRAKLLNVTNRWRSADRQPWPGK